VEVTFERPERPRGGGRGPQSELSWEGLIGEGLAKPSAGREASLSSQALVVQLPVRSVGVMADQWTYRETAALRADRREFHGRGLGAAAGPAFRTRRLRLVSAVDGFKRVVYDITSKPPPPRIGSDRGVAAQVGSAEAAHLVKSPEL